MRFNPVFLPSQSFSSILICWLFVITGTIASVSSAARADVHVQSLRLGFEGIGRTGSLVPIEMLVDGLSPAISVTLTVTAPDPAGNQCVDLVSKVRTDDRGQATFRGVFSIGRLDGTIRIEVADGETGSSILNSAVPFRELQRNEARQKIVPVSTELLTLRQGTICVLTVGEPAGVREFEASSLSARTDGIPVSVLSVPEASFLPESRLCLDAVDRVLLTGDIVLSAEQFGALQDWIHTGGHLIVSSGSTVSSFVRTSLGKWLQSEFGIASEPVPIRDLSALQNYAPGSVQLQTNRRTVMMSQVLSDQVRTAVDSLDGPLVSHRSSGAGVITFVAVDLNQRPLDSWKSLPRVYEMLIIGQMLDTTGAAGRRSSRISSSGISDLSTQLAAMSDAVPTTSRWSTWQVMSVIFILAVVVGPIDYILVVLLLKRPHLTWITFPLWIVLACSLIYRSSATAVAEKPFISRQMHVIDVIGTPTGQLLHSRSWASISSAETRRAAVSAKFHDGGILSSGTDPVDHNSDFRWSGRAEDVYGGMYRGGGAGLGRETYIRLAEDGNPFAEFSEVPMLAIGSQAWYADVLMSRSSQPLFESDFNVSGTGLLEGSLTSHLPSDIKDWILFFGNRVYIPDPKASENDRIIRPGQSWNRRNQFVRASDLKTYLAGPRMQRSQQGSRSTGSRTQAGYNPGGTDPLDILMMMSLHDVTGGGRYTGLNHDLLRRMEVTAAIRLNSALLLGLIDEPLTDLTIDKQTVQPLSTSTVVRLLIPVKRFQADKNSMFDHDPKLEKESVQPEEAGASEVQR